jgi:ABC-type amino acid transport substrate-binding protein
MRPQFQLLVFIVAGLQMAGCSSTPQVRTVPPSPTLLRVGVAPDSPPMIFKSEDRVVGVEADLAQALGQALGRQVVFVEEKWESLIDALCGDRIDIIMSSMSITPARCYRITFSDPYLKIGQMALARADEKYKYLSNIAAQAERGVGVKPGTTADFLVRQELPQATRKYFKDGEEAASGLLRKKIDLFISDAPMIWYLAGQYESKGLTVTPLVLTQEQLGWGLRRTDTELCAAVNSFLKTAQNSGELNRTLNKWIPGFQ